MNSSTLTRWILAGSVAVSLLTACGGGGGDGGGGGGGTTISVSPSTIAVSADTAVGTAPSATIDVTLGNVPAAGANVGWQFTQNGIDTADLQQLTQTTGVVNVSFKNPITLGPGTYNDTVQIGLCTDANCTAIRNGTLHTVAITYTVTGAALGASISPTSVAVQALPFLGVGPQATLSVSLQGAPASAVSVTATSSNNGLYLSGIGSNGTGGYDIGLAFKAPNTLPPGDYTDTVMVTLCLLPGCTAFPGSPISVPVQYSVSATVSGANGYTARSVTATAADLAADPVGGNLYLSVPASATSNGNSIVALDPATATLGASVTGLADPGILAVSDDGSYIYATMGASSSVERYALPGLTPNLSVPMGSGASGALYASEVQVAPGAANTLGVVRRYAGAGGFDYDASIFDDSTQRATTESAATFAALRLQWNAAGDTLYGVDGYAWFGPIVSMTANSSGVALASSLQSTQLQTSPGRLHLEAGRLYTDDGRIFETAPAVGYLDHFVPDPAGIPVGTLPNSAANRAYMVVVDGVIDTYLASYDLATLGEVARIPLPGVHFQSYPVRMVRWGADGLAILCQDQIILVNGQFVMP